jgi:hypothetical protein
VLWLLHCLLRGRRPVADADTWRKSAMVAIYCGVTIVAMAITSTQPFFRNIAPIVPASCLVVGLILHRVAGLRRGVGIALAIAILAVQGYLWRMPDYFHELTHKYVGPVDGIVEFLIEHASKRDIVAITYDDLPVKFYTGLRVVGGLTGEDMSPAKNARWVVIRRYAICSKDELVAHWLISNLRLVEDFEMLKLHFPDIAFHNREDPEEHLFRTASGDDVLMFRRKTAAAGVVEDDPK